MKRSFTLFVVLLGLVLSSTTIFAQGTTSSAMNGRVVENGNVPLPGATVVAIHQPTGGQFATITDLDGFYRIPNMNVGGPYKITISFVGYENFVKDDLYLTLGQTFKLNANLAQGDVQLADVVIVARKNDMFDGNRTGAETVVDEQSISAMPTLSRGISDFTRLTPQAQIDDVGGISIAGINNRYNAISIDGAVNNDVFGLTATGTNGGQTGGTPISMDAIEQFQIVLAPYDVRQGGFAGASINAVTRSGSNEFEGSLYYLFRNESLAGETPTDDDDDERKKLAEFTAKTYGVRLGGPIIKNKLFFFISAEMQRDETPQPFDFADYDGDSDLAKITAVENKLKTEYGYDPGSFLNNAKTLESDKFLIRLDYNLSNVHKITLRHSYVNTEASMPYSSSNRAINYYNNGQFFPSITNSTAFEFKSNFNKFANNLIIGYTTVRDDRDPLGSNFPAVQLYDGSGTIYFGSEPYSTGNQLDQDVLSITDNFNIYLGRHTITLGMNHEFSHTYNLFMRKNFGEYRFANVDDFLNGNSAIQYERGYSLVDDITGDGSAAAADFNMMQLGFYAQDEFEVSDKLKITAGIRMDMPIFSDDPKEDVYFNTTVIPLITAEGYDLGGAKAGQMPKNQMMFSPRLGFNYDVVGDQSLQIRGGLGIFTSRLPLVWPGGSYTNNGVTIGGVYYKSSWGLEIPFESNWQEQYDNQYFGQEDAIPSGQVDLFTEDFKFPQMLRGSLAIDKKLPYGFIATLEGLYTKTLNNVNYYNLNLKNESTPLSGADNRPYWSKEKLDSKYTRIILGKNTDEGFSYNFTAQLQKPFANGLTASLAYTYGVAKSVNDATSSQNSSQYMYMEQVKGLNNLELTYSDFDMGHRVLGFASYKMDYGKFGSITFSLIYNGQSGDRFSYVYNDKGAVNGNGESANNLIYVPASQSEIILVDITDNNGVVTKTAAEQWADLEAFINDDDYLSDRKGDYAERNGSRLEFSHIFDFKIAQDFYLNIAGRKHTFQATLDIYNVGNLINKDWGRRYYIANDAFSLINFIAFQNNDDGTKTPTYQFKKPSGEIYDIDDSGVTSSRWQAQFGIRYIF